MRDDSDERDLEESDAEGGPPPLTGEPALDKLLEALMERLLDSRDADGYLAAVREMADLTPEADQAWRAGLQATARALWNVTPLPWEGFRRRPMPKPERNAPCPCGSGRKYKQCCRNESLNVGFITPKLGEMLLGGMLRAADFRAAEAQGGPLLRLVLAQRSLEEGHPGRAKRILTQVLEGPLKDDSVASDAIDALGGAYMDLGQTDAAITAMRRLTETHKGAPASAAYRVLATLAFEDRAFEEALRLARLALDEADDNPMAGIVEMQALLMLDRYDEAVARLAHWRALARQLGEPLTIELFEDFAEQVAEIDTLRRELEANDPARAFEEAVEAALREPLWPVTAAPGPEMEDGVASVVLTPTPEVEAAHQALFELDPDEVDLAAWLTADPLGLQSPDALERVLREVPPEGPVQALRAFRDRLIEHWLAEVPPGAVLPWGWIEQRGVLRALFSVGLDAEEEGDIDRALRTYERLLALEPEDHQGVRLVLVNLLLREGRNEDALAWIDRYPGLYFPELAFGKVLAHARLGQVKAAEAAFRAAHAELPHVFPFLMAARRKPPADLDPARVRLGGKDQAWYYREDMRSCFAAEPGLLAFLDGIAKRMAQGR